MSIFSRTTLYFEYLVRADVLVDLPPALLGLLAPLSVQHLGLHLLRSVHI